MGEKAALAAISYAAFYRLVIANEIRGSNQVVAGIKNAEGIRPENTNPVAAGNIH
jgi:hypothetical protein